MPATIHPPNFAANCNLFLIALHSFCHALQSLTSASLAACSDAITQRLLGAGLLGARRISLRRMLWMAAYGLLFYGPTNHAWQSLLVSLFPPPSPRLDGGTSWVLALVRLTQRVAADQLLYAPLNNGLMILYVSIVADRRPLAAARAKLVAELPAVQRRGWRLWPAVQLVNQSLVPVEVRLLVWVCCLHSSVASAAAAHHSGGCPAICHFRCCCWAVVHGTLIVHNASVITRPALSCHRPFLPRSCGCCATTRLPWFGRRT